MDGVSGGPCDPGYICGFGSSSSVPALVTGPWSNATGRACSPGTYCPSAASAVELDCAPGSYASDAGQTSCATCPPGFVCSLARTVAPAPCPPGRWCPVGSTLGQLCPDGSFSSGPSHNTRPDDCRACPGGSYCRGGAIAGLCDAGYWCRHNQSAPDPPADYGFPPSTSLSGGLCPAGAFCVSGAVAPALCPERSLRLSSGGACPCVRGARDAQHARVGRRRGLCARGAEPRA